MTEDDRDSRRRAEQVDEVAPTIAAGSVAPTVAAGVVAPTAVDHSAISTSPGRAAAPMRSSHGSRFATRNEIARGGMGRVVEAEDSVLKRTVAVKVALFDDSDLLQRFERETRITAGLEHPSIVPVYDAGRDDDGRPFYVMRRVSGEPLDALVARANRLEDRLALVPHILAAAHALAYAHSRGVIHRDVKPSNILVGKFGETVVIDWGLAKTAGDADEALGAELASSSDGVHTRVGAVVGSPGFMPPEQLAGEPVDARSDVYALGATLYYVLAREAPHVGRTPDAIMTAALAGPPRPLGAIVRGVPRALAAIVDKALSYDRDRRYRDAGELETDLDRFLTGQLVASHHYTALERVARFVRRNRFAIATAVAALIVIAVGAWISVDRVVGERDRARDAEQRAQREATVASDRADEELVARAGSMVASNPTLAVAMVKGFTPSSKFWPRVREIAAAARMSGVAWRLPGPDISVNVDVSPDGVHGLSRGAEGELWLYDLPHHTGRLLGKRQGWAGFVSDGRILAENDATLDVIELSGASHAIPFAGKLTAVRSVGSTVFWVDAAGLWRMDRGAPEAIAISEPVVDMTVSPNGRDLAVATSAHVWLVSTDGAKPHTIADVGATEVEWYGDRVVALIGHQLAWIDPVTRVRRDTQQHGDGYIVAANHTVYTIGEAGYTDEMTGIMVQDVRRNRVMTTNNVRQVIPRPIAVARDTLLIPSSRAITVLDGGATHELLPPIGMLDNVHGNRRSRYVLAVDDYQVVVWDIDDALPARTMIRQISGVMPRGSARAVHVDTKVDGAHWINLETLASSPAPTVGFENSTTNHSGTITFAWPIPTSEDTVPSDADSAHVLRPGTMRFDRVPLRVREATFIDDHHVFAATDNELVTVDVDTLVVTRVGDGHGPATDIGATSDGWLVAGFMDGTLWRRDPTGHVTTTNGVGSDELLGGAKLAIFAGGRVLFAAHKQDLEWWSPEGKVELLARVSRPINYIENIGESHAVVLAAQWGPGADTKSLIDFIDVDDPHDLWDGPVDVGDYGAGDAQYLRLFAYERETTREWHIAAPEWGFDWSIGRGSLFGPMLTANGSHLYGYGDNGLFVWRIPYPADAAELSSLTNGVAKSDHGRQNLTWSTTP